MKKMIFVLGCVSALFAQETTKSDLAAAEEMKKSDKDKQGWFPSAVGQINYSNNSYSKNWSVGGGAESLWNWQLLFTGGLDYIQNSHSWNNDLVLKYAESKSGDLEAYKSADEIDFKSMYLFDLYEGISPYVSATFKSQFTTSYNYDDNGKKIGSKSTFMDPGYFTEGVGFAYVPKPDILARIGYAQKQTISRGFGFADDLDTEKKERFRNELGLEFGLEYQRTLSQILLYKSSFYSFTNFEGYNEIDATWDNTLSAQVEKWLVFSVEYGLVYDSDLDLDVQSRQLIAVGLQYTFL